MQGIRFGNAFFREFRPGATIRHDDSGQQFIITHLSEKTRLPGFAYHREYGKTRDGFEFMAKPISAQPFEVGFYKKGDRYLTKDFRLKHAEDWQTPLASEQIRPGAILVRKRDNQEMRVTRVNEKPENFRGLALNFSNFPFQPMRRYVGSFAARLIDPRPVPLSTFLYPVADGLTTEFTVLES